MGRMSELDFDRHILQSLQRALEDDMGDEPMTPADYAQIAVEYRAKDVRALLGELAEFRILPTHKPFFSGEVERDLYQAKTLLDSLLVLIRCDNGEEPAPRTTPTGLPKSNVRMIRNG